MDRKSGTVCSDWVLHLLMWWLYMVFKLAMRKCALTQEPLYLAWEYVSLVWSVWGWSQWLCILLFATAISSGFSEPHPGAGTCPSRWDGWPAAESHLGQSLWPGDVLPWQTSPKTRMLKQSYTRVALKLELILKSQHKTWNGPFDCYI